MSNLFSESTLSKIKTVHKVFLWVATGIMIASLLLGIILIFVDTQNSMFGRIQGTFFIMALAAFICVNNFIRIEKGNKIVQGFALASFFANIIWVIIGILMVWGALSPMEVETSSRYNEMPTQTYDYYDEYDTYDYNADDYDDFYDSDDYYEDLEDTTYSGEDDYDFYSDYEMDDAYNTVAHPSQNSSMTVNITVAARIAIVAISISSIGFWVSNILVIKDRIKAVKALKITAIVCEVYGSIFVIVMALAWPITIDQNILKWVELSGLTASGFVVTALAAWIISKTHKDFELPKIEEKPQLAKSVVEVEEIKKIEEVQEVEEPEKTE